MLGQMRRLMLAGVSTAVLAGPAMAADLGMPTKAPQQPLPSTWTGPYAGLHLGWIGHDASVAELSPGWPPGFSADQSVDGIIGGGHAGYNWQYQSLVLGVEGDISGASGSGSLIYGGYGPSETFSTKLNWLGTIRGRVGVAFDQWLIYGTAGWAFAGIDNTRIAVTIGPFTLDASETKSGVVWGGGVERMFGRNWTARVEAFHVDLGDSTFTNTTVDGTYITRFTNKATIVRGGVSFKW